MMAESEERESECLLTVDIIGSVDVQDNNGKTYMAYQVSVAEKGRKWIVERRYSDFDSLHSKLRTRFGDERLPRLPPKSYSLFGPSKEFMKERQDLLQAYLQALISISRFRTSQDVCTFLGKEYIFHTGDSLTIPRAPPGVLLPIRVVLDSGEECFLHLLFQDIVAALATMNSLRQQFAILDTPEEKLSFLEGHRMDLEVVLSLLLAHKQSLEQARMALSGLPILAEYLGTCSLQISNALSWGESLHEEQPPGESGTTKRVRMRTSEYIQVVLYDHLTRQKI